MPQLTIVSKKMVDFFGQSINGVNCLLTNATKIVCLGRHAFQMEKNAEFSFLDTMLAIIKRFFAAYGKILPAQMGTNAWEGKSTNWVLIKENAAKITLNGVTKIREAQAGLRNPESPLTKPKLYLRSFFSCAIIFPFIDIIKSYYLSFVKYN